jgi:hypothetical protein
MRVRWFVWGWAVPLLGYTFRSFRGSAMWYNNLSLRDGSDNRLIIYWITKFNLSMYFLLVIIKSWTKDYKSGDCLLIIAPILSFGLCMPYGGIYRCLHLTIWGGVYFYDIFYCNEHATLSSDWGPYWLQLWLYNGLRHLLLDYSCTYFTQSRHGGTHHKIYRGNDTCAHLFHDGEIGTPVVVVNLVVIMCDVVKYSKFRVWLALVQ